jgi:hypothetical protein
MIEQGLGLVGGGRRKRKKKKRCNEYKSRGWRERRVGEAKSGTQGEKNGKRLRTEQRSLKELSSEYPYTYRRHTTTNIHLPTK